MPFTLPPGVVISSGEFAQTLGMALAQADWQNMGPVLPKAVPKAGYGHRFGLLHRDQWRWVEEEACITVREDGQIDVVVGTFSHGQVIARPMRKS
ncbi:MAG: hypothetical protein CM15mP120_11770 [Pseudomonadota bacterium]|nr:MAG: hypothetical protein CM15mP120_11770 [Pseudomonadota bacterium]